MCIFNRFYVLEHQRAHRNLSVTVTPCNIRLNWDLKFIPLIHTQKIICKYQKIRIVLNRDVEYYIKPLIGLSYNIHQIIIVDSS